MPEQLQPLEKLPFWLKPLKEEDKPFYSECDKRIIAYSIAWEGMITINTQLRVKIAICNTDFKLLEDFHNIAKLGHIEPQATREGIKPQKIWLIDNFQEAYYFLTEIAEYIPCERKRKIAYLAIEFLNDRIQEQTQAGKERRNPKPHSERNREIQREVQNLNKRGL